MTRCAAALAAAALACATGLGALAQKPAAQADFARAAALVVEATNAFRAEQGRGRVAADAALTRAARLFAEHMARTREYGHEAGGTTPPQRAERQGYDYCFVSENIAYHFQTGGFGTDELARRLVEGWKGSPGHRSNMLHPAVTHTGVGIARDADTGRYYAVQMFGRPRSESVAFEVRNESATDVRYRVGEREYAVPGRSVRRHEVCAREALHFETPALRSAGPFEPGDRERYVIARHGDRGLVVRRESP